MIPRLGLLCQSFWPSFQAFGEQFLHLTHIFFGKKQLFSTLTKQKRTVFRTRPVSSKELAQTNAKGAFCRAVLCRLCIHHRDTFVYFYQAAFPGPRLRMDKGIIANFSAAFIKFVMICMVCVMKCLACQRLAMPQAVRDRRAHVHFAPGAQNAPAAKSAGAFGVLCFAIGAGDQTVSMPAICLMALMAKVRVRPQAVPPMTQG